MQKSHFMKIKCPKCLIEFRRSDKYRKTIIRYGSFYRRSDRKRVQRFFCTKCEYHFSVATFSHCYRQKKRHLNHRIALDLVGKVSQRDCQRKLKINRKTVVRKFIFMGRLAKEKMEKLNMKKSQFNIIEFDDMETFEHTKCKPLSITLAVESKTRWIIGYEVSQMPAKGPLTQMAMKKYGKRADHRSKGRKLLFERIQKHIHTNAVIKSDQNPHYPADVKKYFPLSRHIAYKGKRGCIVGQGELKKIGFDPLFSLNHTCAVFRARANRLIRQTWDTTKKMERLDLHLALVAVYHNMNLKI